MKKLFYFFAILMALYSTSLFSAEVDTSKYITLTVKKGKNIKLNFKAAKANTPVRIVSGSNTQNITIDTNWFSMNSGSSYGKISTYEVKSDDTTMTIYGDITVFNCNGNFFRSNSKEYFNIISLDVSKNRDIIELQCSYNNLESLDASKNTELKKINCSHNKLTSLDLGKNKQLTTLYCYHNQLTSLDVSKNTQLIGLSCGWNKLTSLDVSKNTQLTTLYCYHNQLTSLDVSNNTQLSGIDCSSNQLTSLDVSNNTKLTWLRCYGNKFTTESMNELYCSLPEREEQNKGVIRPVYKQDDANHAEIVAATSDNARNKNWKVKYGEWNIRELDVPSNGNYDCSNPNPTPNMSKYITLTVQSGKDIKLNFKAAQANTPVRIVSGTNTQDITVGTDWFVDYSYYNNNYTVTSDGTTMTIYGELDGFICSYNLYNLTSLDVSKNTQLTELYCRSNQLTSLDVSKNTQLTYLNCGGNDLTSLDVSKNTQLTKLDCDGNDLTSLDVSKNPQLTKLGCSDNQLTSLDVSKNPQLTYLYCRKNQLTSLDVSKNPQLTKLGCSDNLLTSLDVSKNTQLAYLECHGNKFTTESMNELYCSLPEREEQNKGVIKPLYKQDDANHAEIVAATSDNARAKNWKVKYDDWNVEDPDVPSNGNYECSNTNPTPNMSKYITLTVRSGENIKLNFKAAQANTPVRIVSGTNTQDITVGTDWYVQNKLENDNFSVTSDGTTMTIYGDITVFACSYNLQNLTSLDVSKNTRLTSLYCNGNQLTSLDVSKNTRLTSLYCNGNQLTSLDVSKNTRLTSLYCNGNKFTTESMNELYCSLPDRQGQNKGVISPLYKQDDANHAEIVAATSDNARAKNWEVKYDDRNVEEPDVPSNGNYECSNTNPTPNMSKYITLTVRSGKDIGLNFKAPQANTPVRIVSGTNRQDITVGTDWFVDFSYFNDNYTVTSDGTTMTIYGELDGIDCSYNKKNLTSLDVSKNPQLTTLYCRKNQLTSLDVSKNPQLTKLDCHDNQLTSLDVSKNPQLTKLDCYGNKFTTESMNELYCSLPDREEQNKGVISPVYKQDDANHETIAAATSDNARKKNWNVTYNYLAEDVPSNGNYDCNSGVDEHLSSGISVFPNPASGKVQIKLSESVNETLILVDLAGRAVLLEDVVAGRANIDVSNLTAGTYFIRIGNITKKLTVK